MLKDNNSTRKSCFVITPIGNDADKIRRHVDGIIDAAIKPALEEDFEIMVAHRLSETGSITKQIIRRIKDADLVIANLTERNPNVMYELAFRHCLGTPVIAIAEENTSLPFDIADERTIYYINDAKGALELQQKIKKYCSQIDYRKRAVRFLI